MKISILGGGWLGQPLAFSLQSHHRVIVSKRNPDDCKKLHKSGLECVPYTLGMNLSCPSLDTLFNADLLILNIPPGRKSFIAEVFLSNMKALLKHAKQQGTKKVIFISTTAVYGEATRIVNETSPVAPQTSSAKVHVELENYVMDLFMTQGCVLRLAGLVAKNRHPAHHLAGRTNLPNGQRAVNLIHRDDVIGAITAIINNNNFSQFFHLSATVHPSRQTYYTYAAKRLGLAIPVFSEPVASAKGKQVDCERTLQQLGYSLRYPDPRQMLIQT